jgi:hypothetical protein
MNIGQLKEMLEDFGDHLDVIVEVQDMDLGLELVVDSVDTTILEGETVVCITVGPDVV